jgi:hypothetical protein
MSIKLRGKTLHFQEKNPDGKVVLAKKFVIESLHGEKWLPIGDEQGIFKFETEEQRDAAIESLKKDSEV